MSTADDRLSMNRYVTDVQPHIEVDDSACQCCTSRVCLTVCPAACFSEEEGKLTVAYEGCLECGSCLQTCSGDGVAWTYPRGGFGVAYRYS